jgi:2-phosphoglycolate phosphatase
LIRTVLFDLDGTLADTAPDLASALNKVLQETGKRPIPFEKIRPIVSHGGKALVSFGFNITPEAPDFSELRTRFLNIYRDNLAKQTQLFPGMEELLTAIENRGMLWGVVTNKPAWLTDPLMELLGLTNRAACIISGDTTAHSKPHPEPMLLACHQTGSQAYECVYVGDAQRDIEAGHNAGMKTLVARYGYIGDNDKPEQWGANRLIDDPLEVLEFIDAEKKEQ